MARLFSPCGCWHNAPTGQCIAHGNKKYNIFDSINCLACGAINFVQESHCRVCKANPSVKPKRIQQKQKKYQ